MQLNFFDEKYKNLIEQYQLSEDQRQFTATPTECIKLSNEDPDRYSILAMVQDNLVTFFNLHKNEGVKPYSNNDRSILLRAFSTDFRYQGKGYAKNVLLKLPTFVKEHFNQVDEIVLAVNLQNTVAQGLYKKCGFIDEGERRMGNKGKLIIMRHHL